VDNVLWGGRVIDPNADDPDTRAIRAFNDRLAADDRVETVMLGVADGLTLARKR
jgi:predicted O-methyltransferase YrrM